MLDRVVPGLQGHLDAGRGTAVAEDLPTVVVRHLDDGLSSCTVVVPCRNERDNIEPAVKLTPRFSSDRMVKEYVEQGYRPAAAAFQMLSGVIR